MESTGTGIERGARLDQRRRYEEIELSKVLKIHRSGHAITSEQLAARGVKIR
jgi:hypothetical protein